MIDIIENNIKEIKRLYYEENFSCLDIAKKLNVKKYQIDYVFKKYNWEKRTLAEACRVYEVDVNYFDEINTPNKAYILGFLYADGYNNLIINSWCLSLKKMDEEILIKIQKELKSNKPIKYRDDLHKDGTSRDMASFYIGSKHMCESLAKWGVVQNKTFQLKFPDFLNEDLLPHFIRGYFDGDGCISGRIRKDRNVMRYSVNIMSNIDFCEGCTEYLNKKWIKAHCNIPSGQPKNRIVRFSAIESMKKFYELIYTNADLKLERKYQKFKEFYDNCN